MELPAVSALERLETKESFEELGKKQNSGKQFTVECNILVMRREGCCTPLFFSHTLSLLSFSSLLAKRLAFDKINLSFMDRVDDPALLYWVVQRKKNSKAIRGHFPCHVRVNLDERDDPKQFLENDELIRYMGVNYPFRGTYNRASHRNLVPYYGDEGDHTKWSPKLMQIHLNAMKARPEFKENTELKLRVEELALQYMLDEIVARNEKKKKQAASKAVERLNNPPIYSPAQWEDRPTPRGSPTATTPQHAPFAAALEDRPKQKLRAGDVIQYFHPVMQQQRCEGVIVTVNPPRSKECNIPIEMQDSTLLPPTCHVRLVFRRLNGKMVEPRDERAFYEEISVFQLDPSQNGKVEIITKTEQLGRAYRELQNDLKDCQSDFWRDNAKRKQKDATEHVKDTDNMVEQSAPSTLEGSMKPRAKVPGSAALDCVEVCHKTPPFGPGINILSPATDDAAATSESVAAVGSAVNSFKRKLDRI
jgi:hypothetical protein